MGSEHIIVPDGTGAAGLMVWWELSGLVDFVDLEETWVTSGFDKKLLPKPTTMEVALSRSAVSCLTGKRQLCRPLTKRGSWEIVYEVVTRDDDMNDGLEWTPIVQGWIQHDKLSATKQPMIRVLDEERGATLREAIVAKIPFYQRTMVAVDVSYWLLGLLASEMFNATPMRAAGGFYFIPADKVALWRSVVEVVQAVGQNTMYEVPAMKTNEAVKAILSQVRADAELQLNSMAEYLKGDVSTKGLNATERDAARVRAKLQNYIETLGVALPELTEWCEQIHGAVQAAHMIRAVPRKSVV